MKIVINACFGGFGVSRKGLHRLRELGSQHALDETDIGEQWSDSSEVRDDHYDSFLSGTIPRDDPLLAQVVEELGKDASGPLAQLEVVEIPDGVEYEIEDYDGIEHVAEKHRTWR